MNFYKMKLGDSEWSSEMCATVLRVPGGWILRSWSEESGEHTHGTFVPFNNEFMEISEASVAEKPASNIDYTEVLEKGLRDANFIGYIDINERSFREVATRLNAAINKQNSHINSR